MLAGHVRVGRILSTTVTVCVQVELLPDRSVAVHTTEVVPTGKIPLALQVELKLLLRKIPPTGAFNNDQDKLFIPPERVP
jgi:hypothetical protein